jgi:hypothetical protein
MDIGRFYEASNKGEFDQKCVLVQALLLLKFGIRNRSKLRCEEDEINKDPLNLQ